MAAIVLLLNILLDFQLPMPLERGINVPETSDFVPINCPLRSSFPENCPTSNGTMKLKPNSVEGDRWQGCRDEERAIQVTRKSAKKAISVQRRK